MIRPAGPHDVPTILAMVHELAVYEHEPDAVQLTEPALHASLFGPDPQLFAHVAVAGDEVVGHGLWYVTFSTWEGGHGIWLEDLFVRPTHRGQGHGLALLRELAAICVARGYGRLEWAVLDWNEPAIAFYRSIGAVSMDEWSINRLRGEALTRLGSA